MFLGPIVLQRAIGALIGHGDIHPGSSRILKPISFLWIVRQTLDGHWDFADGNAVLLARWEITDLVLKKRQKRVRIASGGQIAILAVRSTEFQDGRHSERYVIVLP